MKRICTLLFALAAGFGFLFFSQGSSNASDGAKSVVTYSKDVAPILYRNCAGCHRAGQIAPMTLLSYKEVRPWARSIREVVTERQMPPWHADPHFSEFANDRRLSQKEIDTIAAWVDGGSREGDPKDLPPAPKFPDVGSIDKPDVVLSMTEEFSVPADGVVPYKYFAVPTNFTEDKYVQSAEIMRGTPSVVHHVIISVLEPGMVPLLPPAGEIRLGGLFGGGGGRGESAGRGDGEGRGEGSGGGGGQGQGGSQARPRNADGMLLGWAPGMMPLRLAPGQAKLIKKGSVLIFQMHYTTSGVAAKDRTSVALKFANGPIEKRVITTGASARTLVIPPGDPNYRTTSSFTFREDSHILSFMPHMHLRGKDFEYKLVYPDGTSKVVMRVPKYDFNWQITYVLKQPIAAPKGSRLECVAHFDNSAKNKFNPDPTAEVRWGQQTWEEMMIGWFDYTLDSQNLRKETAGLASR
jgi:hypothetical protein